MEAGQRRTARHGVPRPVAHAAPGGRDHAAASSSDLVESAGPTSATRTDADRYDADPRVAPSAATHRDSAGAAHARGSAVQQPHRTAPLPGLRAAGGRAPQVCGLGARASACVPGVEFGAATLGQPRPLPGLERGGATFASWLTTRAF